MYRLSTRPLSGGARRVHKQLSVHAVNTYKRCYSSSKQNMSNNSTLFTVVGVLAVSCPVAYLVAKTRALKTPEQLVPAVATLKDVGQEDSDSSGTSSVASPVKILTLEAANAKIREDTQTHVFSSTDGVKGRIDGVRVPSNNPVEDDWSLAIAKGQGGSKTLFAGVYDGHSGWATSTVLREYLIPHVSTCLRQLGLNSSNDEIDTAIKTGFTNLDNNIMNYAKETVERSSPGTAEALSALAPAYAGSCALLAIFDPASATLRTAVTGDSRAVRGAWTPIANSFVADVLSKDQTGFNQDEVDRLSEEHPGEKDTMLNARTGRLFGMAVTRAFGDHRWKFSLDFLNHLRRNFFDVGPRPNYKTPPYMTASPEVTTRQVSTDDFVILASDGLWDLISNENAVECVSRWLAAKRKHMAEKVKVEPTAGLGVDNEGWPTWQATEEHFAIEDMDNAAVCLVKNAFGGSRRELFRGVMTEVSPRSRYVRDDVTVQVIFFKDPYTLEEGN